MTRSNKWRLIFDLAGLVGLVALGSSLWFGHPHPKWRVPLGPTFTIALGFSADNQKAYSIKDIHTKGNRIAKPILQRWDAATGIFEAEYPLQVPAEDFAQIKADPSMSQDFSYRVHLIHDNLLYNETPAGIRFYDIENGRCLSQQPFKTSWIWYLLQNTEDRHHWGIADVTLANGLATARMYDLNSGESLIAFINPSAYAMQECRLSSDRQYILILWIIESETGRLPRYELEIIRVSNWKSIIRLPLEGTYGVGSLLKPDLLVQTSYVKENDLSKKRLECFRFNPENCTLKPDEDHPFHGLVCTEWVVNNDLLLRHGLRGSDEWFLPWWQQLWHALRDSVRQGKLPEAAGQMDYFVYDFNTGRQLRQLTGLTAFGHQALQMSQDMRYLLGVEYVELNTPRQQTFLAIYEIPHYLWERIWNVLFYVSIFMIFLWPFRLLRRRIPLEPRPVPAP